MAAKLPLAIAPLPFAFPVMREMIQYHAARQRDGGVQWLLNCILDRASGLRAPWTAGFKKTRSRRRDTVA